MNGNKKGFLTISAQTADGAVPIPGATVIILDTAGNTLYTLKTNQDGNTEKVSLDTISAEESLDPNFNKPAYKTYNVIINAEGYRRVQINGVQIFDGIASLLPVTMIPQPLVSDTQPQAEDEIIDIPESGVLYSGEINPEIPKEPRLLSDVYIPEYITVHLGTPDSNAPNVRVKFIDYLKNVGSSEIYPTWPQSSLIANVLAQASITLNRIYTEWYRSRGYQFDITNSTRYDQFFVEGRNIFDSISRVVDAFFNSYVRLKGSKAPYFTTYCNGTTATCRGMSQWGSVALANQGLSPIEILRYYYGENVEIAFTNNIGGAVESFPGVPLREGNAGEYVKEIQTQLNRISQNYPSIKKVNANGIFGPETREAVIAFQNIFSLLPSGVVDKGTWYKISYIYVAVKKLAELDSEVESENVGKLPPSTTIRQGSTGTLVKDLQVLLNYIGDYYPTIPPVSTDGVFGPATTQAVIEFQKTFGLDQDGVVGKATWNKIYNIYYGILNNVNDPNKPSATPYPGTPLKLGSRGEDVKVIQVYLSAISKAVSGIPAVSVDGVFGAQTEAAVKAFQQKYGLTVDGIVGKQTWDKLVSVFNEISKQPTPTPPPAPTPPPYPGVLLKRGSRGDSVKMVQEKLNSIRYIQPSIPKLTADGVFGAQTEEAVKIFQRLYGLSPDGVVGKLTWDKLMSL